jgi:DNA gyrase inhibitor GyrI
MQQWSMMNIHTLRLGLVLSLMLIGTAVLAIEEPTYTVVKQYDTFEVRTYDPYVVAEVVVPGPAQEAGNQGFRLLAAYIFGGNVSQQKMAMTAPVTQVANSEKIAMTAPVTQTPAQEGFVVQFKMPKAYTLDTLPKPLDERVKLREVPAASYAVIRFSGLWSEGNYQKHLQQLQQAMAAQGLTAAGEPVYARYNAPFVPWFLRRNEIWMPVTLN